MRNSNLQICDATIHPGESVHLALPLPELFTCTAMYMPIKVVHGLNKGPCVLVFAAVNGIELNGVEIINRMLSDEALSDIKGTLIAVPVLNIYGMANYPQRLPSAVNIDQCFPGAENGSYGERIAHVFTQQILVKADFCVELLTGNINHNILPQVHCYFENKEAKKIAKKFGAPVITNALPENNPLRQTTEDLNIPMLAYEAGEAMRFDESAIQLGLLGLKNILCELNMLEEEPSLSEDFQPLLSKDEEWIRAPKGGMLHSKVSLGEQIQKGQKIGTISDPFSASISEPVNSIRDGIVVGINENPLISEGQLIFKIVSFIDNEKAETTIENWEEPTNNTEPS